jgi:hypothetical protein
MTTTNIPKDRRPGYVTDQLNADPIFMGPLEEFMEESAELYHTEPEVVVESLGYIFEGYDQKTLKWICEVLFTGTDNEA